MGKVQILAVLTMDGCLSSELYDKAHQDLCLDRCGLDEIRKKAFYRVTPDYSISMLHEWRKDCTNIRYLAEATPDTADYINGLLRMHAVDEIIPIILPGLSGCVWAPVSFMGQADTLCIHFPLPAKETAKKEKSFENP